MFLSLARLSPAAPCPGWSSLHAQVKSARLLGHISGSLRNRHPAGRPRYVCGYGREAEPAPSLRRTRERDVFTERKCAVDASRSDLSTIQLTSRNERVLWDSLLRGLREHGCGKLDRKPPVESVLFTGGITRFSAPRFCSSVVQMRLLSTAATPKHTPGGVEDPADRDRGASAPRTPEPEPSEPEQTRPSKAQQTPEPEPGPEQVKPSKAQQTSEPAQPRPSKAQLLKKVFREYGAVGVSFHVCISIISLGCFYAAVSSGIDMSGLLCSLGFSEGVVRSKMAAGSSAFLLAYAVHKLFAPLRMSATLVCVPLLVRHFRKIGLFNKPPAAP